MLRALSRRLLRDSSLARSVKTSTGIVGLPVDPNARETLTKNLLKIKELMAQLVPETADYRTSVVQDCDEKLKLLKENDNDEALEEILGFQLEQVISMTEDEIKLIPFMAEHKPWEVPADHEEKTYLEHDPFETGFWEGPPGVGTKEGDSQQTSTS